MKKFLIVLGVGLVLAGAALTGNIVWEVTFGHTSADEQEQTFVVVAGESATKIAHRLYRQQLLEYPRVFAFYLNRSGRAGAIQAGTFLLKPGMSYRSLASSLERSAVEEVQVTIPEGFTRKQIGERLVAKLPQVTLEAWEAATGSQSPFFEEFTWLTGLPRDSTLEGYLFPDTYRLSARANAQDVVRLLLQNFARRFAELETSAYALATFSEPPLGMAGNELSAYEIVTLASIVQREVPNETDMRQVADIFFKRLRIGMALQADSTVNYVTGKKTPSVSYVDLQLESPYNTYKYSGLPSGPISNPGLAALDAVLRPSANPYYFFLTTPSGEVKYGRTLEEHNANRRYLR